MKVVKRYTISSILRVGILTALLAALMLMGVDLFKNLDSYTTYQIGGKDVFLLTVLYFPEAFLLGLGPSFLFSLTYFLSQLHANNEYICILNAGIKYKKIIIPCLCTGILISCMAFAVNESCAIQFSNKKQVLFNQLTYESNDNDNYKISLSDTQNGYLVYAEEYYDAAEKLYDVSLVKHYSDGRLQFRLNAYKATWKKDRKTWLFEDVYRYTPSLTDNRTEIEHFDSIEIEDFNIEPQLFRNLSVEVSKMSLPIANNYLKRIKNLNPVQYASMATEFYKRVLSCLTPLVMIIIACSLNYRFKKNVMFFSLICSICIAVVYYVIQMVTLMLADQGVILPILGMLIPFISIIVLTGLLSLFLRN